MVNSEAATRTVTKIGLVCGTAQTISTLVESCTKHGVVVHGTVGILRLVGEQ